MLLPHTPFADWPKWKWSEHEILTLQAPSLRPNFQYGNFAYCLNKPEVLSRSLAVTMLGGVEGVKRKEQERHGHFPEARAQASVDQIPTTVTH